MKRKVISTIFIFVGLFLLAYPRGSRLYQDYQQEKWMKEWERSLSMIGSNDENLEDDYKEEMEFDSNRVEIDNKAEDVEEILNEQRAKKEKEMRKKKKERKQRENYIKKNMEGILQIEKINLNMPILKGATEKNLKVSVSSIEQTGQAGKIGNYSIAGHRNRAFGSHFNRLDEMEEGDLIKVDVGNKTYTYAVVEKLYVKPEETWVLNGNEKDKEITLVTCHPIINSTHRLVIKGVIVD